MAPALAGALAGHAIVGIPQLAEHPLRVEPGVAGSTPVWIDPFYGDGRPVCQALAEIGGYLYDWIAARGADAPPPVIVNVTAGEPATDSPYLGAEFDEWTRRIRELRTGSGPDEAVRRRRGRAGAAGAATGIGGRADRTWLEPR